MITLIVRADGDRWVLSTEGRTTEDLRFFSGAEAERTARRLARQHARSGRDATVVIRLKSGRLAGTITEPAAKLEFETAC